jgi:hypothetical protein
MVTKDEHLVRVGLPVGAMDEARTRVYELHEKLQRHIKIIRSYVLAAGVGVGVVFVDVCPGGTARLQGSHAFVAVLLLLLLLLS